MVSILVLEMVYVNRYILSCKNMGRSIGLIIIMNDVNYCSKQPQFLGYPPNHFRAQRLQYTILAANRPFFISILGLFYLEKVFLWGDF
jgi:hypothetical protein